MKNIDNIAKTHKDKSKKVLKEPFYFLKWICKVECIILIIFFIMIIIENSISDKTKFIAKYNIDKFFYSDINTVDYNFNNIIKSLDKNHFIQEEKDFIVSVLKNEIDENAKYIDINKTIERLTNFKINYNKKFYYNTEKGKYELSNSKIALKNIVGSYNAFFNEINIYEELDENSLSKNYEKEKFCFEKIDKIVLFHEINHLLTRNTLTTNIRTLSNSNEIIQKNILLETINEIFTREYFNEYLKSEAIKNDGAYEKYLVYAYGLIEILPVDTMRKYKFNENESILISGLLDIENNIEEAYKLINSIKLVNSAEAENYKKIHDGYAFFYKNKYNKEISEDLTMLLYFYNTPIQTSEERQKIRDYLEMESYDEIIQIIPKGYFSKNYKEERKGIVVEYTKEGNKKVIEIKN